MSPVTKAGDRKATPAKPPRTEELDDPTIRLGRLFIRGTKLRAQVASAVTSAGLSWSTEEVTQLSLTLADPAFELWRTAEFKKGSRVIYKEPGLPDLALRISAVTLDGGPTGTGGFTVNARSEGVWKLKRRRGPLVMRRASPSDFVKAECKAVGLRAVVQPSGTRGQVARDVRREGDSGAGASRPSSWTTFQRLASELGFYLFEFADTIYFGQPSWLIERGDVLEVALPLKGTSELHAARVMPTINMSDDADVPVDISGIELGKERFKECRPGKAMRLRGLPPFEDKYLITQVSLPLLGAGTVSLSASTPNDPDPQPPGGGGGTGEVKVPPIGNLTIKGVRAERAQLVNATAIYRAGEQMGMSEQAIRIAIATAIQESVLRNLGHGDRDSLGLFQQRASWGTEAERTDPDRAARMFFLALRQVPNWESMSLAQAAQAVQRSAYPDAYAQWAGEASRIVNAIQRTARDGGVAQTGSKSVLDFVKMAQSASNARYVFGAEASTNDPSPAALDCSELIEWALGRVGVKFVDGSSNQIARTNKISVEQGLRTRGALLYKPGHIGISLGDGRSMEARNPSDGVGVFRARDIAWTQAGLVPGLRYQ